MSYQLPAGYFPQLPDTVAAPGIHVSGTMGTGIEGIEGRAFTLPYETRTILEDNTLFPSRDAWKAACLARGYCLPWRYYERSLHPMAR